MFFQKGLSFLESEKVKMIEYKKAVLEVRDDPKLID
jgi:hypothetical protein